MKSNLAIATLIRSRMTELGLSRGEFAKRLGYKNIAKGIRRIDALCDGDLEGTKQFLDVLPQALETSADTVKRALEETVGGLPFWGHLLLRFAICVASSACPDSRYGGRRR